MDGSGVSGGLPFRFTIWVDHEGGAHGSFAGRVPSGADSVAVDGPVRCARIEGNIGVFGWHSADAQVAFTAFVSDGPDGLIYRMGDSDCDIPGPPDPRSQPIDQGNILVSPEPTVIGN